MLYCNTATAPATRHWAGHAGRSRRAGRAAGALACGTGVQQAQAALAWGAGARGAGGSVRGSSRSAADEQEGARQGRAAWALGVWPMRTGWASWVLVHPAWFSTCFFRLGIFPESPNEHCSL